MTKYKYLIIGGGMPDEEAIERLCSLRGVGRWTAEYVSCYAALDEPTFPRAMTLARATI